MENFRIDFTLSNPFPDGKLLGEVGEKNAGQLIITPPENLASREEIRLYVVAFSTERGPFRYGPVPKSDTVTVPVDKNLTVGTALSVQLEGYDENGEFLIKSPVLSGIMISSSIGDCGSSDGTNPDGDSVIPGHFHKNLEVLDSLSEKNGVLSYNNKEFVFADEIKTVVTECFTGIADFSSLNSFVIIENEDNNGKYPVPIGAEIISLELNTGDTDNPVWTDIRNLQDTDNFAPYFVNMHKVLMSDIIGAPVLANVTFLYNTNSFYDAINNFSLFSIRIRYIEGNGESE